MADCTFKMAKFSLPYPAVQLIPHRPPMLLVRQLLKREQTNSLIDAYISNECCLIDENFGIIPELYIEIMAQATAVIHGWDALNESKPPLKGFLVGLNNITFSGKLHVGETVLVDLCKTFEFDGFTLLRGVIRREHEVIVQGEIKVWEDKSANAS